MSRKIAIIGAGHVGATIANDLMIQGLAAEIVLIDINEAKAVGEAMDIYQSAPFSRPVVVRAGEYEDARGADIVIITSGVARKPGMSRLDLAQTNTDMLKDITPKIVSVAPKAIYVIVSNPVDILTYVFCKLSGLPHNQVLGSGTILDTSRLQTFLSQRFHISPKNIHAQVYGEHGDSSFVPWSMVRIANNRIEDYVKHSPDADKICWDGDFKQIEERVHKAGGQIIERKGATFYAAAMTVCHICRCIFDGVGTALTVSSMMHGEYGVDDVCLSTMTMVDGSGVRGIIETPLTEEEIGKLKDSAAKMRRVIESLDV